jgi:hypothetical protein
VGKTFLKCCILLYRFNCVSPTLLKVYPFTPSDRWWGVVRHDTRVARWFVFKPKIQIWVNFGGSCNVIFCCILWPFGLFYGLLLYFMDIWCSSWYFGIFFPLFGILYQEKSGNPDLHCMYSFSLACYSQIPGNRLPLSNNKVQEAVSCRLQKWIAVTAPLPTYPCLQKKVVGCFCRETRFGEIVHLGIFYTN